MKRLTILMAGILLFALTFGFSPSAKALTSVPGPSCTFSPGDASDVLVEGGSVRTIAQSFTTTLDKITYATIKGNSLNNFSGSITVAIYDTPGFGIPTNGLVSRTFTNMDSTVQDHAFVFPGPVDVDSSTTYQLVAWLTSGVSSTGTFYWKKIVDASCYAGGYQIVDNDGITEYPAVDTGFAIYGYDTPAQEEETPAPTVTTPSATSTTTDTTAGAAPAASTTASIKTPTGLKAENVAGATAPTVKLTWAKSTTTDITGYKIFRSTEEKSGFKEIGKVDKAVVEYADATGSPNTKYYYFVRAYKDASESVSSSIVNITTEATPVAETTSTEKAETAAAEAATPIVPEKSTDWILIITIIILILLAAAVTYFELKAKKDGKKVSSKLLYSMIGLMVISVGLIIWRVLL